LAEPIVPLVSAAIPKHAAAGKVADGDYDSLFSRLCARPARRNTGVGCLLSD
jgi:hypothetical protein